MIRQAHHDIIHYTLRMIDLPVHIPVLLTTVLNVLEPQEGDSVLDVTLGLGGHAEAFLEKIGKTGHLTGIDADETNLTMARQRLSDYGAQVKCIHSNFSQYSILPPSPRLRGAGNTQYSLFDIIFADLGVSSPHFDDPERGFSFRFDGPLDLRYDRSLGMTASELIASQQVEPLAGVFCDFGELVREAGRLGRGLAGKEFKTTTELRAVIEELFGYHGTQILPQVFQALRIAVNDEMGALRTLLETAPAILKPGGRFGVLSYHSLEDRMVKQSFKMLCEPERSDLTGAITVEAPFESLIHKAIQADEDEIEKNPRSRSVRFRAIRKKL